QHEAIRFQPVCAVGQRQAEASFMVRAVSRRISGRSRQAKAIENSMPSADNTDGNPQASIPWPTERGGDPLVERSAERHLAQAPRRGVPYEGGGEALVAAPQREEGN